jgi:hypothetical protein
VSSIASPHEKDLTVPVPLPSADRVNLHPPDADEVVDIARACIATVAPPSGLTDLQRVLLEAVFPAMTGHRVDLTAYIPMSRTEAAGALASRNMAFRTRIVQVMLLAALVLRPLPQEVADQVSEFAQEVGVDESMIRVAQEFAAGSLGLAAIDFERNGYTSEWQPDEALTLHTSNELASAWEASVHDPALAARWAALADLPAGTLGRGVWELYRSRGFTFPGTPGSAPPLLAQHDWVHVLADYGTTVESELEVFAFIARANDDLHAFSLLAMVVSLFETGYLRTGAGLFQYSVGHLSADNRVAVRLADAMRRGALCQNTATGDSGIDFLRTDWFELADTATEEVRTRFCVPEKSKDAVDAGSVGPKDLGGISPFQLNAGRQMAEELGIPYESYGARLA